MGQYCSIDCSPDRQDKSVAQIKGMGLPCVVQGVMPYEHTELSCRIWTWIDRPCDYTLLTLTFDNCQHRLITCGNLDQSLALGLDGFIIARLHDSLP